MVRRIPSRTRVLVFLLSLGLITVSSWACAQTETQDDADTPFSIVSRSNVDENLFAFRLLANLYASWPDLKGSASERTAWFASTRRTATAMQGQILASHLDPELDALYRDLVEYIITTEAYLASLDLIQKRKDNQAVMDTLSSLWDAYKEGSDVEEKSRVVMTPEHAANAGKLVGTADALYNLQSKSTARDQTSKAAIDVEAARVNDKWSAVLARLQAVSRRLTARHGWTQGEAGFDSYSGTNLSDMIARSPRDPFLQAQYGQAILRSSKRANDSVPAINAYLLAAELVPADSTYDSLRLEYVQDAMISAVTGAALDSSSYSQGTAPYKNALKVSRTYLAMDTQDATGVGHVYLARALAFAGRYREAGYSAQTAMNLNQNWRNDPGFCIRYAVLMSLNGDMDTALSSMKHAYEVGYTQVNAVRFNPDLAALRSRRPEQFAALTKVSWSWKIVFGDLVPDDVVIQNDSPFDLTNAKLTVHVTQGQQVWDKPANCALIKAGTSCRVSNVFYISGNHIDSGTASLVADQTKPGATR